MAQKEPTDVLGIRLPIERNNKSPQNLTVQTERKGKELKNYRNEDVLFHIHSPTGSDRYQAKNFPARFSINICNEQNQQAVADSEMQRNRNSAGHPLINSSYHPSRNYLNECEQQIKELKSLLQESNQNLKDYEYKIQALEEDKLRMEFWLAQRDQEGGKVEQLESQVRRLNNKVAELEAENRNKKQSLEQLYGVLQQKQQMILQISKDNDLSYLRMLQKQENQVTLEVKQMDKWLRGLSKIARSLAQDGTHKEQTKMHDFILRFQLLVKQNQDLQHTNKEACKAIKEKDQTIERLKQQIKAINKINQKCTEKFRSVKENNKQDHQPQFTGQRVKTSQKYIDETDGTVKIRMDLLLIEKDKRIYALQNEVKALRNAIAEEKNQVHWLSLENQRLETQLRIGMNHKHEHIVRDNLFNTQQQVEDCQFTKKICNCGKYNKTNAYIEEPLPHFIGQPRSRFYGQDAMARAKSFDFDRLRSDSPDANFMKTGTQEKRSRVTNFKQKHKQAPDCMHMSGNRTSLTNAFIMNSQQRYY